MNILFVCTGNVCRSPMADGFLNRWASDRGLPVRARSTGTNAFAGRPATWDARRIMDELGTPIDELRTERTAAEHVRWADLIIGMAYEHVRDTVRDFPEAQGRTLTLKELLEVLPKLPEVDDPRAWAAEAVRLAGEMPGLDDTDVEDPFGERRQAYERVSSEIHDLVEELVDGLAERLPREAK